LSTIAIVTPAIQQFVMQQLVIQQLFKIAKSRKTFSRVETKD
jgi:hypothetical protein